MQAIWISDRNDFSYFFLSTSPLLPTKFRVNWPMGGSSHLKEIVDTTQHTTLTDHNSSPRSGEPNLVQVS